MGHRFKCRGTSFRGDRSWLTSTVGRDDEEGLWTQSSQLPGGLTSRRPVAKGGVRATIAMTRLLSKGDS